MRLEGRDCRGNQEESIKLERLANLLRRGEVTEMGWVKGTSEDPDAQPVEGRQVRRQPSDDRGSRIRAHA
jgi:hypothetical protein